MHFRFHTGSLLRFFILVLLLHEAHELAHHVSAALVCNCWGTRDFLYWQLCKDCPGYAMIIAGFAGPFITYCFMWSGFILLRPSNRMEKKCIGFALVTASLPLPRLLAVGDRGGDEINTMRLVFDGDQLFKGAPAVAGGVIVLALTLPPLWRAFRSIRNKQRLLIFSAFLVIPWLLDDLVITHLLNGWLAPVGFLMKPVYFGTPLLIIGWEVILVVSFLITGRKMKLLVREEI